MARNIGADGRTVYRAVIVKTYADGRTYTAHEGPYTEPGPARARVTFWVNRMTAYGDGRSATGHVEQAHTVWAPVGEQVDPLAAARAQAYRGAADALDASETLRDLTDDHMSDVHAAANELRRLADEIHLATTTAEESDQ
ncbi:MULTISPECIES: hypothetical protein [Streptomyces]|uniref:Uncharacterized protein n=1 Tax=Streptomyces dengpaensis TaxID=2049881 RepID=A0ABM6SV52_9ACTN|nr:MULTISPECIES: hypothetical protein [Streptomyces]AVH58400.1 hypothetical protein C4B68_24470 [Streptomyces dengpaensis]PIB06075.1 hypothetical protein B1C81_26190 [Streptomyces sp. HG99]